MDGQKQRRALSAAEQGVRSLVAGDADKARHAAATAADLDQVGAFTALAGVIGAAAADLEADGIPPERWREIAAAAGPGPLAALAEQQAQEDR